MIFSTKIIAIAPHRWYPNLYNIRNSHIKLVWELLFLSVLKVMRRPDFRIKRYIPTPFYIYHAYGGMVRIEQDYMKNAIFAILATFACIFQANSQEVDYSVVFIEQEADLKLKQITDNSDYVCMPLVKRSRTSINWFTNKIIDISPDGNKLAFLSYRNGKTNIFIKETGTKKGSIQRTRRNFLLDFRYSPDGKNFCFSEKTGETNQIFITDAEKGYVCRQITNGNNDYSPIYSNDMKEIFFSREEENGFSIWSHNTEGNYLACISQGFNPCPVKGETAYLCTRLSPDGKCEIWKVDYANGTEECIISDPEKGFTSPALSPDGKWILFVGESKIITENFTYLNTDIYVAKADGTGISQITYHAADDLSPVWGKDGKSIFFISQRGSKEGTANIWQMDFIY